MMPAQEKQFVRHNNCFLIRNMFKVGKLPSVMLPKKPAQQPLRVLLPYKTEGKVFEKGKTSFIRSRVALTCLIERVIGVYDHDYHLSSLIMLVDSID